MFSLVVQGFYNLHDKTDTAPVLLLQYQHKGLPHTLAISILGVDLLQLLEASFYNVDGRSLLVVVLS